jgi:hypothetical protein
VTASARGLELRATIVARDRMATELRLCDIQIAAAVRAGRPLVTQYWLVRRQTAWDALAGLDAQREALS